MANVNGKAWTGNVTVTIECERGHLVEATAMQPVLSYWSGDVRVSFTETSNWFYCDACAEDDENGEYVPNSTVRSEASHQAGVRILIQELKKLAEQELLLEAKAKVGA